MDSSRFRAAGDSGVVDHNIQTTKAVFHIGDRGVDAFLVSHVGDEAERPGSMRAPFGGPASIQRVSRNIQCRNAIAAVQQSARDRATVARRGTGNHAYSAHRSTKC